MTKEIITINTTSMGEQRVSARQLHKAMNVKTRFNEWFKSSSKMFVDGTDYTGEVTTAPVGNGGVQQLNDYNMTLDMAKHIAMMSGTAKGAEVRAYFIEVEKQWNSPDAIMNRALEISRRRVNQLIETNAVLEQQVAESRPKVDYYDKIMQSTSTVTTTQIAEDYGWTAQRMNKKLHELHVQHKVGGQWILYAEHKDHGYTFSETTDLSKVNGVDKVVMQTKWTQKGRVFIYNLLKQNGILPTIERDEVA